MLSISERDNGRNGVFLERQGKPETTALIRYPFTFSPQMTAVHCHKTAAQSQAESCPAIATGQRAVELVKFLKNLFQGLAWNPYPRVRHADKNLVAADLALD